MMKNKAVSATPNNQKDNFLIIFIKGLLALLASTLGVFVLFGFILGFLEGHINSKLCNSFGSGAVLITSIIGTPIHEISHWIGCLLFGFKVSDVKLLRPVAYKTDGVLGYVTYSYSTENIWQNIGCVFTGMAPMIFGIVFIYIVIRLVTPEIYKEIRNRLETACLKAGKSIRIFPCCMSVFTGFVSGLFKLRKWGILRGIICCYAVMSISMHMTMSSADISNALTGIIPLIIIYIAVALILTVFRTNITQKSLKIGAFLSAALSVGVVFDLLLLLILVIL